jgi:hypothetical protein
MRARRPPPRRPSTRIAMEAADVNAHGGLAALPKKSPMPRTEHCTPQDVSPLGPMPDLPLFDLIDGTPNYE